MLIGVLQTENNGQCVRVGLNDDLANIRGFLELEKAEDVMARPVSVDGESGYVVFVRKDKSNSAPALLMKAGLKMDGDRSAVVDADSVSQELIDKLAGKNLADLPLYAPSTTDVLVQTVSGLLDEFEVLQKKTKTQITNLLVGKAVSMNGMFGVIDSVSIVTPASSFAEWNVLVRFDNTTATVSIEHLLQLMAYGSFRFVNVDDVKKATAKSGQKAEEKVETKSEPEEEKKPAQPKTASKKAVKR